MFNTQILDEHFPRLSEIDIAVAIRACISAGAVNAAGALSKHITRLQIEIEDISNRYESLTLAYNKMAHDTLVREGR